MSEANCNSFFPRDWLTGVEVWPASNLPVPLAFYRAGSSETIDASDSAAFWSIVRNMERDLGRPLFRPVTITQVAALDSGYSNGAVLVFIDPSLGPYAGYTNWIYTADRDVVAARSRFGSASGLASSALVTHELLHALGFHHTCAWPSVMGGYGCAPTFRASAFDAAGFELAYAVRAAQVSGAPTTGLAEARAGELTLELGAVAERGTANDVSRGQQSTRVPAGVNDASARSRSVGGVRVREARTP